MVARVHRSGLTEGQLGILLYTVAQVAWSRLSGEPVLEETEDLIEATRAAIVPVLGTSLAGLRAHRHDQAVFATHALALARAVAQMVRSEAPNVGEDDDNAASAARAGFALWLDFEEERAEHFALADSGHSRVLAEAKDGYRVFTTRYDREVRAATLVRRALLDEYRAQLDARIARAGVNVARLARRLRAALAQPRVDGWSFGEESGRIDGRRLAQLVSSPAERRLFRLEAHRAHADCVVGFLVDCSGSMKARAEPLTLLLDLLTRALDEAGVATEVLGFTTGAWNGGRARATGSHAAGPRIRGGSTRPATWCSRTAHEAGAAPAPTLRPCSSPICSAKASTAKPWNGPAPACMPPARRAASWWWCLTEARWTQPRARPTMPVTSTTT